MRRNYRFIISYDGTRYFGWEHQPNTEMTIQSVVSKIIILSASDVEIEIAGGLTFTEQLPCRKRRVKDS